MRTSSTLPPARLSRREFIGRSVVAAYACTRGAFRALAADQSTPPIVVFSKVYQELKLDFDQAAALTAEAGLQGVDCPARPGGEVLPERIEQDLPRYVDALRRHGLTMPLLTTAITSPASPHTEAILRTAKKLGVQCYRIGFITRDSGAALSAQIKEVKAGLNDLAALNKQVGLTALVQNHSPSGRSYLGGDLGELRELVSGFDPAQIGVAFDIGHALVVHGDDWRGHFEKLKSHLKVAYVKDVKRSGGWVPFGQGDIAKTGYFKLLKEMGYHAPISLHIEFDWTDKGRKKTRAALLDALSASRQKLQSWLAEA